MQAVYNRVGGFYYLQILVKKLNIEIKKEKEFYLFGINTILKDYQLCFLINDFFSIETNLLNTENVEPELSVFGDILDETKVLLVQNRLCDGQFVFPKLKTFEYIVIVEDQDYSVVDIVKSFETKDEILYISQIDSKYIKNKNYNLINQLLAML